MAASTGFTSRPMQVEPPLKGSFPLDRKGVCKTVMLQWTQCMSENKWINTACRLKAAAYLKCRAENNLMAPEEPEMLGFSEAEWSAVQSGSRGASTNKR
ncbi:unnamed protein product [Dicrocoelium dendriticum]|nr:unnamed protein product [Dicrocoelium dendriticum]